MGKVVPDMGTRILTDDFEISNRNPAFGGKGTNLLDFYRLTTGLLSSLLVRRFPFKSSAGLFC